MRVVTGYASISIPDPLQISIECDVIRPLRDKIDYISHFHTAGNPRRNELDETLELYYSAIMRAIADTNYDGFVGQEFSPK